ncbi:hypothetical protein AV540_03935 [Brevibacillus parabrevis]|uniref:hypothetical protein n=1 Tax=Brevibacillus parabrevis TaxID=54914 RepID=UPI0007ABBC35|nr:hypothetical protein AV540_03935 [Brevibacillus parabrevis]
MFTADVLGRTEAAEAWFKTYEEKAKATKEKLQLKGDETAVSLLLFGKEMYVMGNQGLNTTVYGQLGFKPSPGTQKLVDKNERFVDVSNEVLPDYMGSSVWKTISAVQQGRVYILDSKFNGLAAGRDRLGHVGKSKQKITVNRPGYQTLLATFAGSFSFFT